MEAIQTESTKEMKFSEYVHLLAFFIMFSAKNLDCFIFQQMDVDHKDYLRYAAADLHSCTCHFVHFLMQNAYD